MRRDKSNAGVDDDGVAFDSGGVVGDKDSVAVVPERWLAEAHERIESLDDENRVLSQRLIAHASLAARVVKALDGFETTCSQGHKVKIRVVGEGTARAWTVE